MAEDPVDELFPEVDEVTKIRVEGSVVLKILKHCRQGLPDQVTGQLLGLDVAETLEVTDCFPFFKPDEDGEDGDDQRYQQDMLKALRDVNVDSWAVGWYMTAWLQQHMRDETVNNQGLYHQILGRKCVILVFDPLSTVQTKQLDLKAYMLKDSVYTMFKEEDFTQESLSKKGFTWEGVFDEIPVEVHNSSLVQAFLYDIAIGEKQLVTPEQEGTHEMPFSQYLTKSLDQVNKSVDEYEQICSQLREQQQNRRLSMQPGRPGKHDQPSMLKTILATEQMIKHCEALEDISKSSMENIFLYDNLHA